MSFNTLIQSLFTGHGWRMGDTSGKLLVADVGGQDATLNPNDGANWTGGTLGVTGSLGTSGDNNAAAAFVGASNAYGAAGTLVSLGSGIASGLSFHCRLKFTSTTGMAILGVNHTSNKKCMLVRLNMKADSSGGAGCIQAAISDNSATPKWLTAGVNTSTGMQDGNWHSLIITWAPSTNVVCVYVDGVAKEVTYATQATPNTFADFTNSAYLGGYNNNGSLSNPFTGTLDEFYLTNGVVTEQNAIDLHAAATIAPGPTITAAATDFSGLTITPTLSIPGTAPLTGPVTGLALAGTTATVASVNWGTPLLTLGGRITPGQTVTLGYTPGTITDSASPTPNAMIAFSGLAVTNNVATISGPYGLPNRGTRTLVLTCDKAIWTGAADFTVTGATLLTQTVDSTTKATLTISIGGETTDIVATDVATGLAATVAVVERADIRDTSGMNGIEPYYQQSYRPWQNQWLAASDDMGTYPDGWICNPLPSGTWNSGARPTVNSDGIVTALAANTYVGRLMNRVVGYPVGDHVVTWEGTGTVAVSGYDGTVISDDQENKRIVYRIATATGSGIFVTIWTVPDPDDPPRNFKVMLPGREGGPDINPDWTNAIRKFRVLRLMKPIAAAATYVRPATFTVQGAPVAPEKLAELVVAAGMTPWVNIPYQYSQAQRLAWANSFNSIYTSGSIYVAAGNEPWNSGEGYYTWIEAQRGGTSRVNFISALDAAVWADLESVFGSRVIRVVEAQAASGTEGDARMTRLTAISSPCDVYATGGYFGGSVGSDIHLDYAGETDATIVQRCRVDLRTTILGYMIANKALAVAHGVDWFSYECGQALVYSADATLSAKLASASRSAEMGELYQEFLATIVRAGCGCWAHFNEPANYTSYGSWGLAEKIYDLTTPKYAKTVELIDWTIPTTDATAPIMVRFRQRDRKQKHLLTGVL